MNPRPAAVVAAIVLFGPAAAADEGMWTFDNFPSDRVKAEHGFGPDDAWLDTARTASLRLTQGCSASFVSSRGLVMTNHHCVLGCVQSLSSAEDDKVQEGFVAQQAEDELQCPGMETNQLVSIEDVTDRVEAATDGKTGGDFVEAKRAEIARIEKACGGDAADRRCDVVTLYGGGQYHLYAYRRFQDVRLVFAPPFAAGFFGGDLDNFNFPRFNLDVAFLRVYADGKPHRTRDFFRWSKRGPEEGELIFMSGNPGRTSRLHTVAQLTYARDIWLPERLVDLSQQRGMLIALGQRSPEIARQVRRQRFRVENGLKAYTGRHGALVDPEFFAAKVAAEASFRARVAADPKIAAAVGDAFEAIEAAMQRAGEIRFDVRHKAYLDRGSALLGHAVRLVRWQAEKDRPNAERLPEYGDAKLPALKAALAARRPVPPALEVARLGLQLDRMQRDLGPDDPFVKTVLEGVPPFERAEALVAGSGLADPGVRMKLFTERVDGSDDPMIALARAIDPEARATRRRYEAEVTSVVEAAAQKIAAARFQLFGTEQYPDATFSARLTYGTVRGFPHRGRDVAPFTTIGGLFARATDRAPFALPDDWVAARERLDAEQRVNFVSTNDIIGGNSGSPVFNRKREVVGVVFDGNIYSLGGEYGFDARNNRAVSVHSGFIRHALEVVYGAKRLVRELGR